MLLLCLVLCDQFLCMHEPNTDSGRSPEAIVLPKQLASYPDYKASKQQLRVLHFNAFPGC